MTLCVSQLLCKENDHRISMAQQETCIMWLRPVAFRLWVCGLGTALLQASNTGAWLRGQQLLWRACYGNGRKRKPNHANTLLPSSCIASANISLAKSITVKPNVKEKEGMISHGGRVRKRMFTWRSTNVPRFTLWFSNSLYAPPGKIYSSHGTPKNHSVRVKIWSEWGSKSKIYIWSECNSFWPTDLRTKITSYLPSHTQYTRAKLR